MPMAHSLQRMIIERASVFVHKPEAWTRGKEVATVDNQSLKDIMDPRAQRFCARGALLRAACELVGPDSCRQATDAAEKALTPDVSIVDVNDCEGRKAVVRLFDRWLQEYSLPTIR
jgi:hypothetical protein